MDVLVSGVATRLVFVDGDDVSYIEAERPDARIPSTAYAIPYLLADAPDIVCLKDASEADALKCLLEKWQEDRGLRLLQMVIDNDEEPALRIEAANCLSSLLVDSGAQCRIANWAYAIPMESDVDISGLEAELTAIKATWNFLQQLTADQPYIRAVRAAWDSVDASYFSSEAAKCSFEMAAVTAGAFRTLAQARDNAAALESAVLDYYTDLSRQQNFRRIVTAWTRDWVSKAPRADINRRLAALAAEDEAALAKNTLAELAEPEGHFNYAEVKKQQQGVVTLLLNGDIRRAKKFATELVEWQLSNGPPKFAAKSLCNLAQQAKRVGQYSLELEWVNRATEVAPTDAWAHGQAGDVYFSLYRLQEAEQQYLQAEKCGDRHYGQCGIARVLHASGRLDESLEIYRKLMREFPDHPEAHRAWAGYAEVLRDMWKFEDALGIYDDAARRFPRETPILCGRAAVLKDMGRLDDAENAYTKVIADFPDSVYAHGGRADVSKVKGDLERALAKYEEAISVFPADAALLCGKADVLRTMGKFDDAMAAYLAAKNRFPYEPVSYCGYADVLKDIGKFDDALLAYDDAVSRFTFDSRCSSGRANVLKLAGRFKESLQAYDRNVRDFPYDLYSLSGRANLLKELGHHGEAIKAYDTIIERRPDYALAKYAKAAVLVILRQFEEAASLLPTGEPKTSAEWIAYHIRGMILLKQGDLSGAQAIFERGRGNPFFKERQYFESALAVVKIRLEDFPQAVSLVQSGITPTSYLLQIHSYGAMGNKEEANRAFAKIGDNMPKLLILVRNELGSRYGLIGRPQRFSERWLLERETNLLLQAA